MKNKRPSFNFWQISLGITTLLAAFAIVRLINIMMQIGNGVLRSKWIFILGLFIAFAVILLSSTLIKRIYMIIGQLIDSISIIKTVRLVALALFLFVNLGFSWIVVFSPIRGFLSSGPLGPILLKRQDGVLYVTDLFTGLVLSTKPKLVSESTIFQWLLFWICALLASFFLMLWKKRLSPVIALGFSILSLAVIYVSATHFSTVSNYPFSLGWSDVSRYYGASLFFSERLYGLELPQAVLHPAWHILLSLPFLLGNLPIWAHRFWQAFLEIGLSTLLSVVFAKRLGIRNGLMFFSVSAWAFLFIMQGPVIIHLLLCALMVIGGVSPGKFWHTTLVVLLASIWAGLCRINWFPVPGMLAAVLYLLEIPVVSKYRFSYLWKPTLWFFTGTLTAFISNILYMRWSGNGTYGNFSSSLSSELLLYRLLPNLTNPYGVILNLLFVSAPVILIIILALRKQRNAFHLMRLIGIFAALTILMFGGLVVSTKIGGGSDLHNLDAYLIFLMLVGGYLSFGRFTSETGEVVPFILNAKILVIAFAFVVPVWMAIKVNSPSIPWEREKASHVLAIIQDSATREAEQGKEVLFISERHLLALKMVDVPLVAEFEKDFLMEMVMSHNRTYLDRFQTDLRDQRFGLIVVEPQHDVLQGRANSFGEENDLWVQEVSIPLLCYYQSSLSFDTMGIALYVPRDQSCK